MVRALTVMIIALASMTLPFSVRAQQGGTTRYVYDDNGRLRAVVSPTGEAAVYEYDPAGNFTAIRRLSANTLELLDFNPKSGVPGDSVMFIGVGFGGGVNSVSFNGASAQVVSTDATTVVATVPQGATTGLVIITTPLGTVNTPAPFTIRGVRVTPATARPIPGDTIQFSATVVVPGPDQSVRWSVNGIDGGNATFGTITANGLYTVPNLASDTLIIRATSVAAPSLFGEALVSIQRLEDILPAISVGVSVGRAVPSTTPTPAISAGVSVGRAVPSTTPTPAISPGVSVGRAAPSTTPTPAISAGVSVTQGPNISAISPNQLTRGASVAVTINGTNLAGTTAINFIDNNGVFDSSITVSGITVNADGTSLTATVNVSGSSAPGLRVVVVMTASGHSQTGDIGTNRIEIVP